MSEWSLTVWVSLSNVPGRFYNPRIGQPFLLFNVIAINKYEVWEQLNNNKKEMKNMVHVPFSHRKKKNLFVGN